MKMVSIIVALEQQITNRLEETRKRIRQNGDADAEIAATVADIHSYCIAVDADVQLMVNSGW